MRNLFKIMLVAMIFVVGMAVSQKVGAQNSKSVFSITVKDTGGNPISGAIVTVKNLATGVIETYMTDDNGQVRTQALSPGMYKVTAEMSGYIGMSFENINLGSGVNVRIDFILHEQLTLIE